MLSILNKLTMQMELQTFMSNNVFWTKSKITTTKQNINHKNPCRSQEWSSRTKGGCVISAPPSQLRVSF